MHDNLGRDATLKIKTVLITGGTSGIGLGIAKAFDKAGYQVVVCGRTRRNMGLGFNRTPLFFYCDVSDEGRWKGMMRLILQKIKRLDVLVNCAGKSDWRPIEKIDPAFISSMLDVNLKSVFWGTKSVVPHFKKLRGGVIINIASLAGKRGSANNSAYCAAKFGVVGLTQALAKELGAAGIRVNAICPVYVKTPGVVKALNTKFSPALGNKVDVYLRDFALSQAALRRLPTEEEVAQVCVFLASEGASAITGQSINVDCGVMPQ